jgi:hypothetical protein
MDLDQGGITYQRIRIWMGPSLGWFDQQVHPELLIVAAGTYNLSDNTSVVLVNVGGSVTLNLPNVVAWQREPVYRPMTAVERSIWIKDLGGNAAAFPISVVPFPGQFIDMISGTFTIVQNRASFRLYPLSDLTGWYSA